VNSIESQEYLLKHRLELIMIHLDALALDMAKENADWAQKLQLMRGMIVQLRRELSVLKDGID